MKEIAQNMLPLNGGLQPAETQMKQLRKQEKAEKLRLKALMKSQKAELKLREKQEKRRLKAQKKLARAENRWQLAAFKQDIKEIFKRRKKRIKP